MATSKAFFAPGGGEALLRATHEFVSKMKDTQSALQILKDNGYTPANMPDARAPEVASVERERAALLWLQSATTKMMHLETVNVPYDSNTERKDELATLEAHDSVDWAVTHIADPAELRDLGLAAKALHNPEWVPFEFDELVAMVDKDLESLGRKLDSLSASRDQGRNIGFTASM